MADITTRHESYVFVTNVMKIWLRMRYIFYYIVKKIIPQELNYMIYYMKMWHDSSTWMIQINWYIYWTVKWELSSTRLESSSMITCDALCRYMNLVTTSSYKHCIHFLSCSIFTFWIFVMYTYLCIFTCPSLGPNWSINILNLVLMKDFQIVHCNLTVCGK